MKKDIKILLNNISDNKDDNSILELALILERSNANGKDNVEYLANLSKNQLNVVLSMDEQRGILSELKNGLDDKSFLSITPSVLWIMGKSAPATLIDFIQAYLLDNYKTLDAETMFQGLSSLQNCFVSETHSDYKSIKSKLDIIQLKKVIYYYINTTDIRVVNQAKNVLHALDWYEQQETD